MNRITMQDLENLCDRINRAAGTPLTPYIELKPQAGNYHLDGAYGGRSLAQICSDGHGDESIIPGFVSKRELYEKMGAFLSGIAVIKHGHPPVVQRYA